MEALRWILTVVAAGFFLGLAVYNWRFFFDKIRQGDDRMSPAPWVAGVVGAGALWLAPVEGAFDYWWVPFCLDFGSVPNVLYLAWRAAVTRSP